jgi:hypothetical protein
MIDSLLFLLFIICTILLTSITIEDSLEVNEKMDDKWEN